MTEPTITTPGSTRDGDTPSIASAPKDKRCPFCQQAFTSSSLGRHLDLYIKEKNPKAPDGVHDVDEIRKLRERITRRQPRNSAKRDASTPSATRPLASEEAQSPSSGRPFLRLKLNELDWHATGVMRDLPPTKEDDSRWRHVQQKSDLEMRRKVMEEKDNARAAELALREVLASVKAASARTAPPPSPFDYDPLTLTFPALCLKCLFAPSTLFSTQPFATGGSWSIDPPGQPQLESLRIYFHDQFHQWRLRRGSRDSARDGHGAPNGHQGNNTNGQDSNQGPKQQGQEEEDKIIRHLMEAYSHWKAMADKQKEDSWRLEVLRAYARELERRKESELKVDALQQQVEHLRSQVDRLTSRHEPREFLTCPPATFALTKTVAKELDAVSGPELCDCDYDRLFAKWKAIVQQNRQSSNGLLSQQPLPGTSATPGAATATAPSQSQERNVSSSSSFTPLPVNGTGPSQPGRSSSLSFDYSTSPLPPPPPSATASANNNNNNLSTNSKPNQNADADQNHHHIADGIDSSGGGANRSSAPPPSQLHNAHSNSSSSTTANTSNQTTNTRPPPLDRTNLDPSLADDGQNQHSLGAMEGIESSSSQDALNSDGFMGGRVLMGLSASDFSHMGGSRCGSMES
ncbi:hypothetical protein L228DRAFT_282633 [Xylona heveae TC161]|uniref:Uncharacterized protein n=1 Tax=Xylona heveae (strain CBS 132557 / TC161) TaxID=1328760 RepID=A0A165GS34_XYLHT|nr:hypothetical protein L228DRAFT_282633 [Xylona heveae TC161]KZF22523.1 hypothetical protein L228DRAFT_282633 [Xylona heveae TC161]